MVQQKLFSLANRRITQARDIFDLYLLLNDETEILLKNSDIYKTALTNLAAIKYDDFLSQVVAFLTPDYQSQYANKDVWQHIIDRVKKKLIED